MKLFLSFLIITGLGTPSCLGFMEELDSIDMTFMLPIMYRPLKDKPEHGICFQESKYKYIVFTVCSSLHENIMFDWFA